jgi:hypothetical protein
VSQRPDEGDRTLDSIRARYRAWSEANPRPRGPSAITVPVIPDAAVRVLAGATGVGLGLLLLALAVIAFWAAASWGRIDRGGAAVAYTLTGLFLTVAGAGAILATLNHLFNVLRRPPAHH